MAQPAKDPECKFYLARHLARGGAHAEALKTISHLQAEGFLCSSALQRDPWLQPLSRLPAYHHVLTSFVELRLEAGAIIALSQNPADWPAGVPALINSQGAKNIALTGRGHGGRPAQYEYVEARGMDPEIRQETEIARKAGVEMKRYYRTGVQKYIAVLRDSEEIRIEGVRLINAPLWTLRLQDSNQVWIRGVSIYSDLEKGVNADGIDIVSTSNVAISDSTIITADDAIVLKTQGWRNGGGRVPPTENITVTNCLLSSSSTAMMIGTETNADIRHVVFSNIVVRDSNKVFGINVQDGATVSDVRFHNVTFELNRRHWNWWGSAEVFKFVLKKRTAQSALGRIENITIAGARARRAALRSFPDTPTAPCATSSSKTSA